MIRIPIERKDDLVRVVRCKDCKHYGKLMNADPDADKRCLITDLYEHRPSDWYCADGERREDVEIR